MAKSTILSFSVLLVSLLAVVSGNPVTPSSRPTCITNTIVPAQVQLGPTRTLYRSTATCTSSLDCAGCSLVVKSLFPAVDIVPFRTTVTAEVTTTTAYVCHSCSSSDDDGKLRSRNLTTSTASVNYSRPSQAPLRFKKRQTNPPPFSGQAQQQVMTLATAIYIVEVIDNGGNLTHVCRDLNVTALYLEGLDGKLAKQKICAAAINPPPPTNSSAITDVISLATALYAVEVAGNYAGGTNLTTLCNVIDVNIISLLGFDGASVKDFVCAAASGTSLAPTATATTFATAVTAASVTWSPTWTPLGTTWAGPVLTAASSAWRYHHSRETQRSSRVWDY